VSAQRVIVWVRCAVSKSRVFRTMASPWPSAVFTTTKRIEGRDAASAIASAFGRAVQDEPTAQPGRGAGVDLV